MAPVSQRGGAEVYRVLEFTALEYPGDESEHSREGSVAGRACGLMKCLRFFFKKAFPYLKKKGLSLMTIAASPF